MIAWCGPDCDIFSERVDALVNPVNCVGISGKGLALEFKRRFPYAQLDYERACREGGLHLGTVRVSTPYEARDSRPLIVHLPTKHHWRDPSRLHDIEEGLTALRGALARYAASSVAIPALGCGNGGLGWKNVRGCIEQAMIRASFDVIVFAPHDGPQVCRVCGRTAQGLYGWKGAKDLIKADLCELHARQLRAKAGVTVLRNYRKRSANVAL